MNIKNRRLELISKYCDASTASVVEIGALDSPTFRPPDVDVKFIDFTTRERLAKSAANNPRYAIERLVEIDYVCPDSKYGESIDSKFDLIIANHVVEHISNVISWFRELDNLMAPGGYIFLAVPDRRYTFDIARKETGFIDLIRNDRESIRKPSFYQIFEHFYYHKSIKPKDVWSGNSMDEAIRKKRFTPKEAYVMAESMASGEYQDVHCNVFTSDSFKETFETLFQLEEIELELAKVTETYQDTCEFHAVFKKS